MAFLVAGLFFTVSCAKKTVVSDATTIESQAQVEADDAKAKSGGMSQKELDDQMANENTLEAAKIMAAKKRFENQDIHFEYDSSDLSSMTKLILKEKAAWLKENYSVSVSIEGHCDERGTTEYNLSLGERRSSTVKAFLVNLGISSSRLNTISYGEEMPIDTGKTEEAFRKNRRAHFVIE